MRLKVGELAKRSGLTVRTLHHYHAIGLLTPSARADNGYRLYDRHDIARLPRSSPTCVPSTTPACRPRTSAYVRSPIAG